MLVAYQSAEVDYPVEEVDRLSRRALKIGRDNYLSQSECAAAAAKCHKVVGMMRNGAPLIDVSAELQECLESCRNICKDEDSPYQRELLEAIQSLIREVDSLIKVVS